MLPENLIISLFIIESDVVSQYCRNFKEECDGLAMRGNSHFYYISRYILVSIY